MSYWIDKFKRVKNELQRAISYTLPIKLVLGLLVTAIGSASVLGLLSEFAVYNYALVKGFRVPVEGIPYLRPTVTLISLCLLVFSALGFVLVYSFAKSTAVYMSAPEQGIQFLAKKLKVRETHVSKLSLVEDMRSSSKRKVLFISTLASAAVVAIFTIAVSYIQESDSEKYIDMTAKLGLANFDIKWQLAIFVTAFVIYISAFRPRYIKNMAITSSLVSVLLLVGFMFNGNLYSGFLNAIGFGGERDITIISKDEGSSLSGKLLIQSNEFYFVLISNSDVVEFPLSKVDRVIYPQSESFWLRVTK
ncbi:hypothetical protein P7M07_22080 [Vibrio parahaemolyticus]|jgi:hypothetical protein|uniref:hypothetical protein n=1 Tax=Vibrio TaxID=662 RepID=UPI00040F0E3C|nr:hypothetical protein [Vibrio parahaemolyticus]EJE3289624.1 hypothetical protein [Vibrio alginolyticus]ELA7387523.1 hypothetical protein [Vibrio alginolyticus]MDG2675724.1 hypothetical protein [Vibrio parahaemolyticus]HBK5926824.1 hypothetical protein [Vibrio alginolyticus]